MVLRGFLAVTKNKRIGMGKGKVSSVPENPTLAEA